MENFLTHPQMELKSMEIGFRNFGFSTITNLTTFARRIENHSHFFQFTARAERLPMFGTMRILLQTMGFLRRRAKC